MLNLFPARDRVQWVPVPSERPRLRRSDHTPSSWVPTWRDPGVRGVLKTTAKTAQKWTPPHFFFLSLESFAMVRELFFLPRELVMVSGALAVRLGEQCGRRLWSLVSRDDPGPTPGAICWGHLPLTPSSASMSSDTVRALPLCVRRSSHELAAPTAD